MSLESWARVVQRAAIGMATERRRATRASAHGVVGVTGVAGVPGMVEVAGVVGVTGVVVRHGRTKLVPLRVRLGRVKSGGPRCGGRAVSACLLLV